MKDSKNNNYVVVSIDQIAPLFKSENENDCKKYLIGIINNLINDFAIMKEDDYYKTIAEDIKENKEEIEYIASKLEQEENKKTKILH